MLTYEKYTGHLVTLKLHKFSIIFMLRVTTAKNYLILFRIKCLSCRWHSHGPKKCFCNLHVNIIIQKQSTVTPFRRIMFLPCYVKNITCIFCVVLSGGYSLPLEKKSKILLFLKIFPESNYRSNIKMNWEKKGKQEKNSVQVLLDKMVYKGTKLLFYKCTPPKNCSPVFPFSILFVGKHEYERVIPASLSF